MSASAGFEAPVKLALQDRFRTWREGLTASAGFRRWAARFPLTRPFARRRARALFDLCAGFVYSQVLYACVRGGVLEALRDGPLPLAELARRAELPLDAARTLLDAAATLALRPKGVWVRRWARRLISVAVRMVCIGGLRQAFLMWAERPSAVTA